MKHFFALFLLSAIFSFAKAQTVEGQLLVEGADTLLVDAKGYRYSFIRSGGGISLGVAPGGRYEGRVEIPAAVRYQGVSYPVTTVRKNAMMRYVDDPDSAKLISVSLPHSVTLVGTDAFAGNVGLKDVRFDNDSILVETRAFFRCPSLGYRYCNPPLFAYTKPSDNKPDRQYFIHPVDNTDIYYQSYSWAFFKNRHNGIRALGPRNADNENAMACYSANLNRVRSIDFQLRDPANTAGMFSGYSSNYQEVVILDNNYVASRHFPSFSRWCWGEPEIDMDAAFVQQMERSYGRKVRYAKEAASIALDGRLQQVVVTEFDIANKEAMVVVSWVVNGQVRCSWIETQVVRPDYNPQEGSLWNVDDEGSWGIPTVLLIAQDDRENVELFLLHSAPETQHYMHLQQKGPNLVLAHEMPLYVLYE